MFLLHANMSPTKMTLKNFAKSSGLSVTIPNLLWTQQLKTIQERDLGLKGDVGGGHWAKQKRQTFAFTPTNFF